MTYMMNTRPLLAQLADGETHSGELLAATLGISRTAIWKQIRRLQDEGVEVETIRGRGYRLRAPLDLLTEAGILEGLSGTVADPLCLKLHDSIDSTNSDVARRWQGGETGMLLSVADAQEQGRGRRGRAWHSPLGKNLYMSLGLTVSRGFTELDGLSLVAGLALLDALEELGLKGAKLKWPNDVLVNGKKLAGVLIELQGELEGAVKVIVGIGVNVHMKEVEAVDQPWTSLCLESPYRQWARGELAGRVIEGLVDRVRLFEKSGFGVFQQQWNRFDAFYGCPVVSSGGDFDGTGRGVDDAGNYLVETNTGLEKIRAGEISLRIRA